MSKHKHKHKRRNPYQNTNIARNPLWNTNINAETHTETETQTLKWVIDGGLGLGAWVGNELRKKDGWSLAGERHTQIEQCGGTTKAPPGQGWQDAGEKLDSGSEQCGFSLCAGSSSLLLFPLGFERLGFFFFFFLNVCIWKSCESYSVRVF